MQTVRSSAPSDLAQIFEPIREDLEAVEQAYASHIQSKVDLIPQIAPTPALRHKLLVDNPAALYGF